MQDTVLGTTRDAKCGIDLSLLRKLPSAAVLRTDCRGGVGRVAAGRPRRRLQGMPMEGCQAWSR